MKYILILLISACCLKGVAQTHSAAEGGKDYLPESKTMNLSLVGGVTISQKAEQMLKYNFKEKPELQRYFLEEQKNVRYFRGSVGEADLIYELKYLNDGRIYQMNLYMAHNGTEATGSGMMALKIIFNGCSSKILDELGKPSVYHLIMSSPYSDEDYEDNELAMKALRSGKLINSAQWWSKKYEGTKWDVTPVVELSMHFANRVRISVTDIELLKLL